MPAAELSSAAHEAAVKLAYQLVEAAQGHHDPDRVDAAQREAERHGWDDVRLLLQFARLLAGRESGAATDAHIEAMHATAERLAEPSLLALTLAAQAMLDAGRRRSVASPASAARLLVDAVILLDDEDPAAPVMHRATALIEVGLVALELGLWELSREYLTLAEQALARAAGGRWREAAHRQQVVVTINRCDLLLEWSCALAAIGDWEQAAELAASALAGRGTPDEHWPPSWVGEYHASLHLLAAIAGVAADGPAPAPVAALAAAIRAARAGDDARAAALAEGPAEQVEVRLPGGVHLLALGLAARMPGAAPAARRYGDQLARLRWNDRLDRMEVMRDAIAVGRRRRDHEQLRRDIMIDELTGLANRRGYQAYLAAAGDTGDLRYAVLMVDVDRFKQVNDTFGHEVGDRVLARLGRILAAHVRPSDLAARLGGDEFVAVLTDAAPGVPQARAEHILDAVRTYPWGDLAAGLSVSVSIGVHHGSRHELPALLQHADQNLYRAKHHGRGRVATSG